MQPYNELGIESVFRPGSGSHLEFATAIGFE